MLKINKDLRRAVVEHALYDEIRCEHAVRNFMKYHVFCVWDFQSLVKKMQQLCSAPALPWLPGRNRQARRLMNEIVLEEESDVHPRGGFCSHFELYLDAMEQAGADTGPINSFLNSLSAGDSLDEALRSAQVPAAVKNFVFNTFDCIAGNQGHEICASFTRGRETIIPDMFSHLISSMAENEPEEWGLFHYYLQRHVEVDGDTHGPASELLLESFCKTEAEKAEAVKAAELALRARLELWDMILSEV